MVTPRRYAGGDVLTLEMIMLGSAAVSACCCVAPRAGASRRARMLAGAMVAVMVAVTLDAAPVVQYAGALLLLAFAVALVTSGPTERGPEVEWHRTAGAVLMALAVLMHQHGGSMAIHHMAAGPRMDHGTVTGHDAALVLLRAATAAYLCWMAAALVRLRNRPITDLLRWEHLAMGASLAAMIFFMSYPSKPAGRSSDVGVLPEVTGAPHAAPTARLSSGTARCPVRRRGRGIFRSGRSV